MSESANDPASPVHLLRMELAAVMEPYEVGDCITALLDCVEAGAVSSDWPQALPVTIKALRDRADKLDAEAKRRK